MIEVMRDKCIQEYKWKNGRRAAIDNERWSEPGMTKHFFRKVILYCYLPFLKVSGRRVEKRICHSYSVLQTAYIQCMAIIKVIK